MTIPAWPESLPYDPDMTKFNRTPARGPIVTTPEDGPDLMAVRSKTLIIKAPMALRFDSTELATFTAFWRGDLAYGTRRFTMPVLLEARTKVTRLCYIENANYVDEPFGLRWIVSFPLCIFFLPSS
jgi:hypothetical protein